ncbi:MAG: phenylalanine--tRNA ligase subunit beta [Spirochaetes bacterium]|nr:MAG: phenylalanine--tRNA ligase subunit beta [Spirochaetota bacterium]
MWISFNILKRMVDLEGLTPEDIASRLTMATAEIDGIEHLNEHLKTVITARIVDLKKHPNADKLTLCDMDTGTGRLHVVCGAPNHKSGDIVPLATVGTRFTEDFTVKKSKIRGEESSGMLCSAKELGLSDDHSGIMILPPDTALGIPLAQLYPDWADTRIEIDNKSITHRPDLWSHAGFAREIAALFGRKYTSVVDFSLADSFKGTSPLTVSIKDADAAPRYCGLAMKNIRIAESPDWLKAAVSAIGMRPINNIVDITNYVMVEIGEPMHAFDRAKLRGNEIIVRLAGGGETLTTLDGQVHALTREDVVIADSGGAIALAGVMGGGNSEIEDGTHEIVLEAANFNPVNIRKSSGRFSLRTEAAIRFEKSLDPELCPAAIIRCCDLIMQAIPGAEPMGPIVDAYPAKAKPVRIVTSTDTIRRKLGHPVDDARIKSILGSLDFGLSGESTALAIDVPTYRATKDVSIPDDIVEEVGRIFGYDNIPQKPPMVPCAAPARNLKRLFERRVKDILVRHHNMIEVSHYSFVGDDALNRLGVNDDAELRLKNPLSSEQDRLRRSLLPNLVRTVELNQRFHASFKVFELGRTYMKVSRTDTTLAGETTRVTGAFFQKKTASPLFYSAKTAVADLLDQLRIREVRYAPAQDALPPYAHPGKSMRVVVGGKEAGLIFELHPRVRESFGINGQAALFDLDMDALFGAPVEEMSFTELQKFPEVPFEVSVLADRLDYAGSIADIIRRSSREFIRSVRPISVYQGDPIPAESKSVSFEIIFAARERTLGPEEIDKLQKKVIQDLAAKGYKLR